MKKKIIIGTAVGFIVIITVLLLTGGGDSHHTNLKHLLWKWRILSYDPAASLRYLEPDLAFRQSLHGKTRVEVNKWFPDLRSINNGNEYQKYYNQHLQNKDFLWIGDSHWGIEFEDGKVKKFRLLKG